jgi:molybdopterin-guanine dinucleotide biosynthesis protein A
MNAILLAGGDSRRFGCQDKALASWRGDVLIKIIADKLNQVFSQVYVVVDDSDSYSFLAPEVELITDLIPDKGPLGGLYTGLTHSSSEYNYLAACDMPLIPVDYLQFLHQKKLDYEVLLPKYSGYLEPLAGIYNRSCLPAVKNQLDQDNLKVTSFFPEVTVKTITEEELLQFGSPKRLFFNINYRCDLNNIARQVK